MPSGFNLSDPSGIGVWLALHALVAAVGTWAARAYARRRALLDHPDQRRSHVVATPRGGGIGIVLAWALSLSLLSPAADSGPVLSFAIMAGLLLVAGVGWLDDHRALSPWPRLAVHALAAAIFAAGVWYQGQGLASAMLAFLAVPVLVNVWNFMDGIDGLAASQAALAAAAYALIAVDPVTGALALALSAACCGFLPFNFPRARVFLGDVGSGALGYALAVLLTLTAVQDAGGPPRWPLLALPLSAFLIDASLTLGRRMLRGDRWWTAHVEHAYQQLAFRLRAHWPVTLAYAAWTTCALSILLFATAENRGIAFNIAVPVSWCLGGALAWRALTSRWSRQNHPGHHR